MTVLAEIIPSGIRRVTCPQCGDVFGTASKYQRRCDQCMSHCVKCNEPIAKYGARAPAAKYCPECANAEAQKHNRDNKRRRTTAQRRTERARARAKSQKAKSAMGKSWLN
jgi:hypothetical protein